MSTPMNKADALAIRTLLAAERDATKAQVHALTLEVKDIVTAAADVSTDDEHDPEGATIAFERARVTALLDRSRERLADLESALRRLAEGRYGTCEVCGRTVDAERLLARPSTRTCISCASQAR